MANENGIDTFAKLPINPDNAALVDSGQAEKLDTSLVDTILDKI